MATVGIAELKARLSQHLERVKAGEEVVITERDRPIARIVPLRPAGGDARWAELVRRGTVTVAPRPLEVRAMRRLLAAPRPDVPAGTVAGLVDADRDER